LYFVSNRGGEMDLWRLAIAGDGTVAGEPEPITTGIGMLRAAFSPDGKKLAYSRGRMVANLWRVPILRDRPATWNEAQQLTSDQAFIESVDVSPDGRRLVISSDRAGNLDLWSLPVEGGEMQRLTTDPTPDWCPTWSPDGTEIAFHAYRSGNRDLWVMSASGAQPRRLTHSTALDAHPSWSPDGQKITFWSTRSGNPEIYIISVSEGEVEQITDHPTVDAMVKWSPDGKSLLFLSSREERVRLWRLDVGDGSLQRLTNGPAAYSIWSRDGEKIYFTGALERARRDIWEVPAGGGAERTVTDLSGKHGNLGLEALATDGEYLYFTWEEDLADIWVMDVFYE
jgi:Tol biopolymer transport system component